MHWDIERRSGCGVDAEEFRWRHSDNGEWDIVEKNGLADRVCRSPKPFLTRFKTQNSNSCCTGLVIVEANQPARGGRDPNALEVFAGHQLSLDHGRAAAHDQIQRPRSLIC